MSTSQSGDGTPPNKPEIPRGLINRTGNPTGRGSRLPSVRGQRDLTLGGVQRKVFTPNLAAVKKSSKEENSKPVVNVPASSLKEHPEGSKSRSHAKSDRGRGRGRGGGRGEDKTIQLQSEFSHGPMGSSHGSTSRAYGGGTSGSGGGSGRSLGSSESGTSVSSVKSIKRSTESEEDKRTLDSLLKDDFISDISSADAHMTPIKLPLHMNLLNIKKEEGVKVKEEPLEQESTQSMDTKDTAITSFSDSRSSDALLSSKDILSPFLKSDKGELILIQLPDTLPGVPAYTGDDQPQSSTSGINNLCQLKDCNEGYMGKLRIRKSGKTELVLEDNVMTMMPGIPINFHQELVSIHTDRNPGQMIVLGPVNHKIVVTPDYSNLLQNSHNYV